MQTFTIRGASRRWGSLLREAHREETPFTLRLRYDWACVAAPHTWFKRACRGLDALPVLVPGYANFREQRDKLNRMAKQVLSEGAFVSIPRMDETACVLVPIPWYEERVKAVGPPAGAGRAGEGDRKKQEDRT